MSHRMLVWIRHAFYVTYVYNDYKRLSLAEVGREWGEGEWVARSVWERGVA